MNSLMTFALFLLIAPAALADLTIYTDRPTDRIRPIAEIFTAKTGLKVTIVEEAYPTLLKRIQTEGSNSPADLIFTKDLIFLSELARSGHFQSFQSDSIASSVESSMRDPQNLWTAVSKRARTIMYNPNRVQASELSTYEDLADLKWAGRLCLRTGKGSYNEALVSSLIVNHGAAKAKEIVAGWVENLAVDPFPNDTKMLEAVANGICDVAIANTYYLARMIAQNPKLPVKAYFSNQNSTGAHINGSGIGVAATSKQAALASQFIEILLQDDVQLSLTGAHFEYPAKINLLPSTLIREWGGFKADSANWSVIGAEAEAARQLIREVEYN